MTEFSVSMIEEAAERMRGKIVRTPLLESPHLNALAECRVLVKAEPLQLAGAFKMRGAMNHALMLTPEELGRGIVAFSTGNHGQAVAATASRLGTNAIIVMPNTAPRIKIDNCRWWGAEVRLYDPETEDREAIAAEIQAERGLTLIPPFDDHRVMAGQGTVGLEIADDLKQLGIVPDQVVLNVSGGGLAAGVSTVLTDRFPGIEVSIVEPAGRDKMARALTGRPQPQAPLPDTIMDALAGPTPGTHTQRVLATINPKLRTVTDDEALRAIAAYFSTMRIVVEPGGAASLAAVLATPEAHRGKTVVTVASGGNIDPEIFSRALEFGHTEAPVT